MVEAVGGIFLYSENPKALAEWYSRHFDLKYEYTEEYNAYYISFPYREAQSDKARYTVFSILHNKSRPFIDGKYFTVNLRVKSMDTIVERLNESRIELRGPEVHDEGKFAWLVDPEGNYLELWEDTK